MHKIAILQPEIPHYRQEFFTMLRSHCELLDLYTYNSAKKSEAQGLKVSNDDSLHIKNFQLDSKILFYNPFSFLNGKYDTIVLMLHFAHITTWLLLITKWIHRKRIILWGQGISVKRYEKEHIHPDWRLKWMIKLADGIWTYQQPEAKQWHAIYPNKPIVSLVNTLSGTEEMIKYRDTFIANGKEYRNDTKNKYNISQEIILIFCARFESSYRRTDLLLQTIEPLDTTKYGFIIIGAGRNKPDFSNYKNVYDFGAVYDTKVKRELFSIADLYFQPGWVGLSIVEAMAYGRPVMTFRRSAETLQCVEYCYIEDGKNGMIFNSIEDCVTKIDSLTLDQIQEMGNNACELVRSKLTISNMVHNALTILNL